MNDLKAHTGMLSVEDIEWRERTGTARHRAYLPSRYKYSEQKCAFLFICIDLDRETLTPLELWNWDLCIEFNESRGEYYSETVAVPIEESEYGAPLEFDDAVQAAVDRCNQLIMQGTIRLDDENECYSL